MGKTSIVAFSLIVAFRSRESSENAPSKAKRNNVVDSRQKSCLNNSSKSNQTVGIAFSVAALT